MAPATTAGGWRRRCALGRGRRRDGWAADGGAAGTARRPDLACGTRAGGEPGDDGACCGDDGGMAGRRTVGRRALLGVRSGV
ncbi:hypothetical protein GUJ93_ZPchr0006g44868 [Zizania palustris]|uniref:Uncharacterized protein n=1 Tax=Zizania palustris TaxID=103762 RepID=A0A8J5T792_ZIZPA|nr:hypothetical protein GUJ93_ZPchr0006g44868 [Zizania palustris]